MRYSVTIKENIVDFKISNDIVETDQGNNTIDLNIAKQKVSYILSHIFYHIKNTYRSTIAYKNTLFDLGDLYISNMDFKLAEMTLNNIASVVWLDYYNNQQILTLQELTDLIQLSKAEMSIRGTALYNQKWNNESNLNNSQTLEELLSKKYFFEVS